jgi:hypothetical protein
MIPKIGLRFSDEIMPDERPAQCFATRGLCRRFGSRPVSSGKSGTEEGAILNQA